VNPNSFIVSVLFDFGYLHRPRVELDPICFAFDLAQLCEESSNVLEFVAGSAKQIDVLGDT
jgi:hypothetical protein